MDTVILTNQTLSGRFRPYKHASMSGKCYYYDTWRKALEKKQEKLATGKGFNSGAGSFYTIGEAKTIIMRFFKGTAVVPSYYSFP